MSIHQVRVCVCEQYLLIVLQADFSVSSFRITKFSLQKLISRTLQFHSILSMFRFPYFEFPYSGFFYTTVLFYALNSNFRAFSISL